MFLHEKRGLDGVNSTSMIPDLMLFSACRLAWDSLGAVQLRTTLEDHFGLALPATAVFDYPTAAVLAKYISSLSGSALPSSMRPRAESASDSTRPALVHLVDISSRYPYTGGAGASPFAQGPLTRFHTQPDSNTLAPPPVPHRPGRLCCGRAGRVRPWNKRAAAALGRRAALQPCERGLARRRRASGPSWRA